MKFGIFIYRYICAIADTFMSCDVFKTKKRNKQNILLVKWAEKKRNSEMVGIKPGILFSSVFQSHRKQKKRTLVSFNEQ